MPAADPTVTVAVATFRRPDLLARMLPMVVEQATALGPGTRVVVVDNDPEASGRSVLAAWPDPPVRYVHEPRPGIAAARNRAIHEAADADAVVFIDDDEEPTAGWLEALVSTWQSYGCDAVAGPTVPVLVGDVSPWVRECPTFRRVTRVTGTVLAGAASGNLLIDLATLRREALEFSDAYGLTGGSDTLLSRTLSRRGGVIRWCEEAEAREAVPPDRAERGWVLRRNRRVGNVWSRVHLELADSRRELVRTWVTLMARGAVRVARGVLLTVRGRVTSDIGQRATGECHVAAGLGLLSGATGRVVTEYIRS
ncbi:glycosyltransferase family 2 protein [Nocardioides sp. HDW12B]|uniref:glycosyltransferase family 2 protein n=1 Tax=Nocardioides sp. HDW12B TaxID=2714939 RepID=UPI00140C11CE|nr:glycosyltransferase family 2 protein [Nocardioides sp. HDW12B]QIK65375.1 glycosyltransferase family 2 protein [Nocardioides sp. HDW12B]